MPPLGLPQSPESLGNPQSEPETGQIPGHSESIGTADDGDRDDLTATLAVAEALRAADLEQLIDIYNRLSEARQAELLATAIDLVEAQTTEHTPTPNPKSAT